MANTGVFWNLDDCEIPDDVDIYQNVKSALANQGCHGQMSMWAYCEEAKEPIPGITLVSPGEFRLGPLVLKSNRLYLSLFHFF